MPRGPRNHKRGMLREAARLPPPGPTPRASPGAQRPGSRRDRPPGRCPRVRWVSQPSPRPPPARAPTPRVTPQGAPPPQVQDFPRPPPSLPRRRVWFPRQPGPAPRRRSRSPAGGKVTVTPERGGEGRGQYGAAQRPFPSPQPRGGVRGRGRGASPHPPGIGAEATAGTAPGARGPLTKAGLHAPPRPPPSRDDPAP